MLRLALGFAFALGVPLAAHADDYQKPAQAPAAAKADKAQDRGIAQDAQAPTAATGAQQQAALDDAEVLSRLHHINQLEIQAGKLAADKGQLQQVKSYGQMLQKDHAKADQDLTAFAKQHKIDVREPKALSDADRQDLADMDQLPQKLGNSGDFDRAFADAMLQGHSDAIAMIEMAQKSAKADVKGFYGKLLPTLRHHRDQAADIVATIEVQGDQATGTSGTADDDMKMDDKTAPAPRTGKSPGKSGDYDDKAKSDTGATEPKQQ